MVGTISQDASKAYATILSVEGGCTQVVGGLSTNHFISYIGEVVSGAWKGRTRSKVRKS